jgi:hypothetical protein
MTVHKKVLASEVLYLVLFLALGLVSAPWYDRVHTYTALDKYWNDLIDHRIFVRFGILMPYCAFQFVRSIAWSVRTLRKKSSPVTTHKTVRAREWLYLVLFVALGLVCTPLLFYQGITLVSIWDDTTYKVTAFDKYWDDLVKYRDFAKVWWKILMPYFAFQFVRALVWSARTFKKNRYNAIRK